MSGRPIFKTSVGATAVLVHGAACSMTDGWAYNDTASKGFVQMFDAKAAADVTVGTTTPYDVHPVLPGGTSPLRSGKGVYFKDGVVIASTSTPTGSTGVILDLVRILIE